MKIVFLWTLLLVLTPVCAADNLGKIEEVPPGGLGALFNVTARPPRPGEWIEYRIAFPADPLENSLRPDPALMPQADTDDVLSGLLIGSDGEAYIKPSFEPQTAWRVLPLRLEVTAVDPLGFTATLRFAKESRTVHFPIREEKAKTRFYYETPLPQSNKITVVLDSGSYEAVSTMHKGDQYGFVRWSGNDAPFGLFRFATGHIDLVLVGMGTGTAPDYPLTVAAPILPAPGLLYRPRQWQFSPESGRESDTNDDSF